MKSLQLVVTTITGKVHKSAAEPVTEREYDTLKDGLKSLMPPTYLEFNTEDGWIVIVGSQIESVQVVLV